MSESMQVAEYLIHFLYGAPKAILKGKKVNKGSRRQTFNNNHVNQLR